MYTWIALGVIAVLCLIGLVSKRRAAKLFVVAALFLLVTYALLVMPDAIARVIGSKTNDPIALEAVREFVLLLKPVRLLAWVACAALAWLATRWISTDPRDAGRRVE